MRGNQVIRGNRWLATVLAGILLALAVPALASAAPPSPAAANSPAQLRAQLDDTNAKLATARSTNARLESQVAQLEQKNEARSAQMQQRDAEIAALRAKLQAAGAPASASTP